MKRLLITIIFIMTLITSFATFKKERGSVAKKFVDEHGKFHIVVKFTDGATQDNIVDKKSYVSTSQFEFYTVTRK